MKLLWQRTALLPKTYPNFLTGLVSFADIKDISVKPVILRSMGKVYLNYLYQHSSNLFTFYYFSSKFKSEFKNPGLYL